MPFSLHSTSINMKLSLILTLSTMLVSAARAKFGLRSSARDVIYCEKMAMKDCVCEDESKAKPGGMCENDDDCCAKGDQCMNISDGKGTCQTAVELRASTRDVMYCEKMAMSGCVCEDDSKAKPGGICEDDDDCCARGDQCMNISDGEGTCQTAGELRASARDVMYCEDMAMKGCVCKDDSKAKPGGICANDNDCCARGDQCMNISDGKGTCQTAGEQTMEI